MPSAPTSIAVATISGQPNQLLVSWQPPRVPNGQLTEYMSYCFEPTSRELFGDGYDFKNDSTPSNIPYEDSVSNNTVLGSEMSAVMGGFEPYTEYYCVVVASTSIGTGMPSPLVSGVTDQSSKPTH